MTIWWADEDLASYDAWILALQSRGINVRTFSSASQVATAVQDETGGEPSLVIVYLMMSLGEDVPAELTNLIVDDDRLVGLALAQFLERHPRSKGWPFVVLTGAVLIDLARLTADLRNVTPVWSKAGFLSSDEFAAAVEGAQAIDIAGRRPSPHEPSRLLLEDFLHSAKSTLDSALGHVRSAREGVRARRARDLNSAEDALLALADSMDRLRFIDQHQAQSVLRSAKGASTETLPLLLRSSLDRVKGSTIRVDVHLPNSAPARIAAAPAEFTRVVVELAVNALKFGSGEFQPYAELICREDGVQIRLTSSGTTFTEEDLRYAGTRGWRSREAQRRTPLGLGYGLWLVRRILEHCGGTLTVRLDAGNTVVECAIPWDDGEQA